MAKSIRSRLLSTFDQFRNESDRSRMVHNSICKLMINTTKGIVSGTGFFIHPQIVITAGHCVLEGKKQFARSVDILPGLTSSTPVPNRVQFTSSLFHVNRAFFRKPSFENDFGFIILQDSHIYTGDRMGLSTVLPLSEPLTLTGYPFGNPSNPALNPDEQVTFIDLKIMSSKKRYMTVEGTFYPGQSGSPVYSKENNTLTACGIYSGSMPNSSFVIRINDTHVLKELDMVKASHNIR